MANKACVFISIAVYIWHAIDESIAIHSAQVTASQSDCNEVLSIVWVFSVLGIEQMNKVPGEIEI